MEKYRIFSLVALVLTFIASLLYYGYIFQHGIKVGLNGAYLPIIVIEIILLILAYISFKEMKWFLVVLALMVLLKALTIFTNILNIPLGFLFKIVSNLIQSVFH